MCKHLFLHVGLTNEFDPSWLVKIPLFPRHQRYGVCTLILYWPALYTTTLKRFHSTLNKNEWSHEFTSTKWQSQQSFPHFRLRRFHHRERGRFADKISQILCEIFCVSRWWVVSHENFVCCHVGLGSPWKKIYLYGLCALVNWGLLSQHSKSRGMGWRSHGWWSLISKVLCCSHAKFSTSF